MNPDELLAAFGEAADAQRDAIGALSSVERRAGTDRPGQYALDLVADAAVLDVLHSLQARIVSEESGLTGVLDAPITLVVDPVDGSTNCARGVPYWGLSVCALDADGPFCALVTNTATGTRTTSVRGGGAWREGRPLRPAPTTRVDDGVIALSGWPARPLAWQQFRSLGSAALSLCDVASGALDGFVDAGPDRHGPWDYLGGVLACREAGAVVVDAHGRSLDDPEPDVRRQLVAGATAALTAELLTAVHVT